MPIELSKNTTGVGPAPSLETANTASIATLKNQFDGSANLYAQSSDRDTALRNIENVLQRAYTPRGRVKENYLLRKTFLIEDAVTYFENGGTLNGLKNKITSIVPGPDGISDQIPKISGKPDERIGLLNMFSDISKFVSNADGNNISGWKVGVLSSDNPRHTEAAVLLLDTNKKKGLLVNGSSHGSVTVDINRITKADILGTNIEYTSTSDSVLRNTYGANKYFD